MSLPSKTEVAIIGGGPVGLTLALYLEQAGISCQVIEQREAPVQHSRSLGIHPVSLELFQELGILDPFLAHGLKIRQGLAFQDRDPAGTISFDYLGGDFPFILSIPQYQTESILEDALQTRDPDVLHRGWSYVTHEVKEDEISIAVEGQNGQTHRLSSRYLIGCDGKRSRVRANAGIGFEGGPYPDTYMMGDFADNTDFGSDAAVYLHHKGLIECFPLPDGQRRWVVKTEEYHSEPTPEQLAKAIKERLNHQIPVSSNRMISSFGVQRHLAEQFYHGRIALAGDAAHVVSPIGGQGMNLGWLDGKILAEALRDEIRGDAETGSKLEVYARTQRKVAEKVIRRAELNMGLGRAHRLKLPRKLLLLLFLHTPLKRVLARLFTMKKLYQWPL